MQGVVIRASSLKRLLSKTKNTLLEKGKEGKSQRGLTWSLNNVTLIWMNPGNDENRYPFWSKKDDEWYQNNFVRKKTVSVPEKLTKKGELLFPYTYAHRSRYYDNGWGYLLAVAKISKKIDRSCRQITHSQENFQDWLIQASEYVHLQIVLAILKMWGKSVFDKWSDLKPLESQVNVLRFDILERVVSEIKNYPQTRRAITPSLMYTTDYQLDPMMGVPNYQNFQLLPSSKNSTLCSLHWHRSLDATGGAQLDFNHDFDWLSFASRQAKRKMGSIAIVVGNLHLYAASQKEAKRTILPNDSLEKRLCMWTDGYRNGSKVAQELLKKDVYNKNAKQVYLILKKK